MAWCTCAATEALASAPLVQASSIGSTLLPKCLGLWMLYPMNSSVSPAGLGCSMPSEVVPPSGMAVRLGAMATTAGGVVCPADTGLTVALPRSHPIWRAGMIHTAARNGHDIHGCWCLLVSSSGELPWQGLMLPIRALVFDESVMVTETVIKGGG